MNIYIKINKMFMYRKKYPEKCFFNHGLVFLECKYPQYSETEKYIKFILPAFKVKFLYKSH